jgi:TetR/AcrR family transcriptional regulator, transcriptional repressor for nem operon
MPRVSQRARILDAAMHALHEQGFNATGVQDITDAAGVPKGSFYNHFESKEVLGAAALDRYFQERTCERMGVLSDTTLSPLVRLQRYFENLSAMLAARDYVGGCMIGNLSAELADQSRLMRDRLASHFADWTRALESCVREAQATGEIRADLPAPAIASFLLNSWEGAILRARVERTSAPFDDFMTVGFATLRPA